MKVIVCAIMWDEEIHKGAIIVGVVIAIIVGGFAMSYVWIAPDQVVQNSGNPQLQASYQTGKEMINSAGDLKDGSDLANAVRNSGG